MAQVSAPKARFLRVSKDIDALLALVFGRVEGAIVTPGSIEVLKHINPVGFYKIRVVVELERVLHPPLCRYGKELRPGADTVIIDMFKTMMEDDAGRRAAHTLGYDSWVEFDNKMITAGVK